MTDEPITKSEDVEVDNLFQEYHTLRVGEEIPRLEISRIRKITNRDRDDNLAGVDFKYIIETKEGKYLRVNTWSLWKKIAAVIREAGTIHITLELKHPAIDNYSVRRLA